MLTRVIDYLKTRGVTALFTSLATPAPSLEATEAMISSLMDTWMLVAINEEDRQAQSLALRAQVARHAAFERGACSSTSAIAA